jgi:hypothetical protein
VSARTSLKLVLALMLVAGASAIAVLLVTRLLDHARSQVSRRPGPRARVVEQIVMRRYSHVTTAECKPWHGPGRWNYFCDYYVRSGGVSNGVLLEVDRSGLVLAGQGAG